MPLSPPRPPLAPLNALRAFESAVRHGSFQRAAEDLGVTPGAIAQQVKKLEDWAGGRLFERRAQGVTPTTLAKQVVPDLTQGFELLGKAAQQLRLAASTVTVRIAALPAIAQLWLSPRLSALQAALPDVELSIHALDTRPTLGEGEIDLAIYPEGTGEKHQRAGRKLAENLLLPVCNPTQAKKLKDPADLAAATLIHDAAWKSDWDLWLRSQGLGGIDAARGPTHTLYSIAVERCLAGDGILIGHTALIAPLLSEGRLVALFPTLGIAGDPMRLFRPDGQNSDSLLERVAVAIERVA